MSTPTRAPWSPEHVARVLAADRAHVWHPYTPMDEYRARHDPFLVASAEGPWLTLADGSRVLDGNGQWWVSTLGHNHPRLVNALRRQAEVMCHVSLAGVAHEAAALCAQDLAAVAPKGLDQVFFSDDGSTAVESAVKMTLQAWQQGSLAEQKKTRFLALEGAFHGETIGATSLGGVEVFRRPFASIVFDCIHVPSPAGDDQTCAPLWGEAFDAVAQVIERDHATIAGILLEPLVQGAAGMRMYPPAYLRAVRDLCDKYNVTMMLDEVFTGYGRTGAMWASELAGIAPDVMCVAKGFTAGVLPMAATLASSAFLDRFGGGRARAFLYGHSFCGNPLGAAVAREVLAIYRDERIVEGVAERHAMIAAAFTRLQASPVAGRLVRSVRSLGMIGAADLRDSTSGYTAGIGWRIYDEARRRGAYVRPMGDVVYVAPALNIPLDDLSRLLAILEESIEAVAKVA